VVGLLCWGMRRCIWCSWRGGRFLSFGESFLGWAGQRLRVVRVWGLDDLVCWRVVAQAKGPRDVLDFS